MTERLQDFTGNIVVNLNVHDIDATGPKNVILMFSKRLSWMRGGWQRPTSHHTVAKLAVIDSFVLLKGLVIMRISLV